MPKEWRHWEYGSPQIPWAPILITRCWTRHDDCESIVRKQDLRPEFNIAGLMWKPTGIYRQEYFEVTGQWL